MCWDGWSDGDACRRRHRKRRNHGYSRHGTVTERHGTGQHKGEGETEGERDVEVESESRAEGVSACDDWIDAFFYFSHLIFGPLVWGEGFHYFSVMLKVLGVTRCALMSRAMLALCSSAE